MGPVFANRYWCILGGSGNGHSTGEKVVVCVLYYIYITHLIVYSTLTNEQKTYFHVDSSNAVWLYYFSA